LEDRRTIDALWPVERANREVGGPALVGDLTSSEVLDANHRDADLLEVVVIAECAEHVLAADVVVAVPA
jgi:hypothetical protein